MTAILPAGAQPCAIAVNPATNRVYVANYYGGSPAVTNAGTVTVIDGATNATATVSTGDNPRDIAVNPVSNMVYVANFNSPFVTAIDGASNAATSIAVASAGSIAVNPVTNRIYVGGGAVIDGATNAITTVPAGSGGPIAVNPMTNRIYVASWVSTSVTAIDGATNAAVSVPVGSGVSAIAVNMVTDKVYVANTQSGTVTVIDGATNATTTIPVGIQPLAVAVNPVTNRIYVANLGDAGGGAGSVTVIDGYTNGTTTVAAGSRPSAVAVNTVSNKIYVTDGVSAVTVIDGDTNATTAVNVGAGPSAIAVNPVTNMIYVADAGGNAGTVAVIDGTPAASSGPSARLVNLSARAMVGTGGNVLIPGFVIGGSGIETLLIRGVGPGLASFGITGALAQPSLSVADSTGTVVASNTGWGTNPDPAGIASAAAQVGAFAMAPGSADSAVIVSLPAGAYTVLVSGVGNTTGVALAEVYEVSHGDTRLINISTRAEVGTGASTIITGFVISGTGTEVMLVRADGPGLAQFGVTGAVAQPSLSVYDSSGDMVATNTGWGHNFEEDLTAGFAAAVGAFPLAPGSPDSAQFVNLAPGAYSMLVSGANNTAGIALAEAYEAP